MKFTRLTLSLIPLLLSAGLLRADLTRTEFSRKGEWTVQTCREKDKFVRSEMTRTYNGKHEVHLRLSFDGENFHIDSTADWNGIPEAKSHRAEYRIDRAANEPSWQGQAKVIEEADGMTWLRITKPNEPGALDGVANAMKLIINVGPPGKAVTWNFDLQGSKAAYTDLIQCFHENTGPADGTGQPAAAGP